MTRRAVWKRKMALTGNVETALINSHVRLAKIPIQNNRDALYICGTDRALVFTRGVL